MKFIVIILTIKRNNNRLNYLLDKIKTNKSNLYENLHIFYGIDYKKTNIRKYRSKYGLFNSQPVVACALSHILCWKFISTLDIDYAIVLEDDTFMIEEMFLKYKPNIENIIKNNKLSFINSPDSGLFKIKRFDENFTQSILNFGLDTVFVTPQSAKKLFDFYKNFGITFHIDQELFFVCKYLDINYVNLDIKLVSKDLEGQSSMVSHSKLSILFNNSYTYKNLKTPFFESNDVTINALIILMLVSLILISFYYKETILWKIICLIIGFFLVY